MMKSIKEKLIHLLGGYTKGECNEKRLVAHCGGSRNAYENTLIYLQSISGLPAEEWCKKVYEYVEHRYIEYTLSKK
jgi:hypothetical protein